MQLSRNFSLQEMIVSQTAARRGLSNIPTEPVIEELKRLCRTILEPLRTTVGRPIVVSSGYRSLEVNKAVGGSATSAHVFGKAADIIVPGLSPFQVCKIAKDMNLPYDQVILEFDSWTHISSANDEANPKRQALTAVKIKGSTVYKIGLVNV
jgi:hypothetical protein